MLTRRILLALAAVAFAPLLGHAQDGWLLFRGNAQRTGAAAKLPNWKEKIAWQRPLFMDKIEGIDEADDDRAAKALIESLRKDADPTILPAFYPIIIKDLCVYRSYSDVRCVAMQKLTFKDDNIGVTFRHGEIMWKTMTLSRSISQLLESPRTRDILSDHVVPLLKEKNQQQLLWANATIGSISSDGKTVYIINDIVSPPMQEERVQLALKEWKFAAYENALHAYSAISGKRMWDMERGASASTFDNSHFLGAPVPQDKKLYVLNEKDRELRLVTIDLDPKLKSGHATLSKDPLRLMKIPEKEQVLNDPLRRTQPLHLAYADGLLVCPTHAGVVFGVDRAKMTIRWQYRYRDEKSAAPVHPYWQGACPVIAKDRIVFTAADAPDIHCLGLDGKKLWTAPADKDLYLATVHDDIVLLASQGHCRALALADGKEKWRLATGLPAGIGVMDGAVYYLPLQKAAAHGPAIWAIDLAQGKKLGRVPVPYPDALGNLALHRGMLVSQSVTHIAAFPLTTSR